MVYSKTPLPTLNLAVCSAVESLWLSRQDEIKLMDSTPTPEVDAYAEQLLDLNNVERGREFPLNLAADHDLAWLLLHPRTEFVGTGGTSALSLKDATTVWAAVPKLACLRDLPPTGQAMFRAMGRTCVDLAALAPAPGDFGPAFADILGKRTLELCNAAVQTIARTKSQAQATEAVLSENKGQIHEL